MIQIIYDILFVILFLNHTNFYKFFSFGTNTRKQPKMETFLESFIDSLQDPTLKILLIAAIFTLFFSYFSTNKY